MRKVPFLALVATMVVAIGVSCQPDSAEALQGPPGKITTIARIYPDLHAREVRRVPTIWNRLRKMTRVRWEAQHPAAARAELIKELIIKANSGGYGSKQTKDANWALLHLLYSPEEAACAAVIIGPETAGTWDHRIEYGQQYGPNLIYSGEAYGLGQALPGTKMLPYGADAATNPRTQLRWFRAYAQRYGGICGSASHWTPNRSW